MPETDLLDSPEVPPTRYANSGGASIAYQVFGSGPADLVLTSGPASHIELLWEEPSTARALRQLASFTRLVIFDRRGTGLSDGVDRPPTLEQQVDDLLAVMGAVGMSRTAVWGATDAGLSAMFAATHPDRVTALVLWGVTSRGEEIIRADVREHILDVIEDRWGQGELLPVFAPSRTGDLAFRRWWAKYERYVTAPGMARKILALLTQSDITALLPNVRCPTLVVHRRDDSLVPVSSGRRVAELIPNARFIEIPGTDNYGFSQDVHAWLDAIEAFLTGTHNSADTHRSLCTVMFTDIVDSTARAAAVGDRAWSATLAQHDTVVQDEIERWRGQVIKRTGDGFLATFDGPARAVRCAKAIGASIRGAA